MGKEYKAYKKILKYFILALSILYFLALITFLYRDDYNRRLKLGELKNIERNIIITQSRVISKEIENIVNDLNFLVEMYDLKEGDKLEVQNQWALFCKNEKKYDHIRYIDKFGNEKIRINYFCGSNECRIIDSNKLQNKSNTNYVKETLKLKKGQIFISKMDLNIEDNKVEEPIKPVIRFSTPIVDNSGNVEGMIVINYLAENTLEEFKDIGNFSNGQVYLLNEEGYFLYSDKKEDQWGFMYEDRQDISFKSKFKEEWEKIEAKENMFITDNGLFLHHPINLQEIYKSDNNDLGKDIIFSEGSWIAVSFIDKEGQFKDLFERPLFIRINNVIEKNLLHFINIIMLALVISLLFYLIRKAYNHTKFLSEHDSMTKTLNRRAGLLRFKIDLERHKKDNHGLSLCFIDVNGLKRVNDVLGHNQGDELITTVVNTVKSTIRDSDYIIRVGGDEFIIVFNNIGKNQAKNVWQRISNKFEKINLEENRKYKISVSSGIVEIDKDESRNIEELINMADEKMYEEKRNTLNRYDIIK